MNFYISDLHIGHKNIIDYDSRPFANVEEMKGQIVKRWNNVVTSSDTVYVLGDVSFASRQETTEFLHSLRGHIVLIKGNHDCRKRMKEFQRFEKIVDYLEIKDYGKKIVLCHFPIMFWNESRKGSIHLYGHVHNGEEYKKAQNFYKSKKAYNVGCMLDYMDYTPRTLEYIMKSNGGLEK